MSTEIGATLRETRMRARIDIGEVEMRTKIRAKYLRAIENEEWDLLPGPIYVKSFLRTYAEYLGLDARGLLDEYKRRFELPTESGGHGRPLSAVRRERERERVVRGPRLPSLPSWTIIVVVLIAAGVALYLIGRNHNNPSPAVSSRVTHHHKPAKAHKHPVTRHTTTRTVAAAPPKAHLKLVPTDTVWICVQSGDGRKLVNGVTATAGMKIAPLSAGTLLVTFGNSSVTMTADGKPYHLSPSAVPIGLKISPTGVSKLPSGPTCA